MRITVAESVWLIKNYIPRESLIMCHGASGAGKSLVALDMALHIATGKKEVAW